jgi:predicted component of type VI protein secretion system
MGRETVMDEFVEAVRQVDASERQVAEQRRIVDLLTEFGRDTRAAREQLMALEQAHAHNMSRRDQLRALLEE